MLLTYDVNYLIPDAKHVVDQIRTEASEEIEST